MSGLSTALAPGKPAIVVKTEDERGTQLNKDSAARVGRAINHGLPYANCRDSSLGRMLFNLYNKGKVEYTPNVRISTKKIDPQQQHKSKLTSKSKESVAVKKKYSNLKLKKATSEEEPVHFPCSGGRRSQSSIELEISNNPVVYRPQPLAYIESRQEKIRKLQDSFSGLYTNNTNTIMNVSGTRRRRTLMGNTNQKRSPNQQLFDTIVGEIDERQKFLEKMRELGQAEQHENTIKAEIAQRLRELKELNKVIESEEEEMTKTTSTAATAATTTTATSDHSAAKENWNTSSAASSSFP